MRGNILTSQRRGRINDTSGTNNKPVSCRTQADGLEPLEPRLLLSGSLPGAELQQPASASSPEILAAAVGIETVVQTQTQFDNFFKPNVIAFDFAIDPEAVNGSIQVTALSDLDNPAELVVFDAEGIVSTDLFTGADDGLRPFTATINLSDIDLAALANDGNLRIEFTPSNEVDDFAAVQEYVTVELTYELEPSSITLAPVEPLESGVYTGSVHKRVADTAEVDTVQLQLEAGTTLRLEGVPDFGLALQLELVDPNGGVVLAASSSVPGAAVLPQAIPVLEDGEYVVSIRSLSGLGDYTINAFVNQAIEDESIGGGGNNVPADAQDLTDHFVDLGNGVSRAVVLGTTTNYLPDGGPAIAESFESGSLGSQWTTSSSTADGRVFVSSGYGAADGSYALLMDTTTSNFNLNEAIWTVDLSDVPSPLLSFSYAGWNDPRLLLPTNFSGSASGDGVSISDDGEHWFRVLSPNATTGTWGTYSIDLVDVASSAGLTLGPDFKVKFQQHDNGTLTNRGRGYDNIRIEPGQPFSSPPAYYGFTLNEGEVATIRVDELSGDLAGFVLTDSTGAEIASNGFTGSVSAPILTDFKAPEAGVYLVRVIQNKGPYQVTVVKQAGIAYESGSPTQTQPIGRTGSSVGVIDDASDSDLFDIPVIAGDVLTLETSTPNDGASGLNTLDPQIELFDPSGNPLALDDNSAPDGRNAKLTHTALQSGMYQARITGVAGTVGNYLLSVSGFMGTVDPAFTVTELTIDEGELLNDLPVTVDVTFSQPPMRPFVDAEALTLNGVPATFVTRPSETVYRFYLPESVELEGTNTIEMAAGAIQTLVGVPLESFTRQFELDQTPPTVIESSILEGDVVPAGDTTIVVKFSEPVSATGLTSGLFTKLNTTSIESSTNYNPLTQELTLVYAGLAEGSYTFTLDDQYSSHFIRDVAGNVLDGEANPTTTVPSGNGVQRGDFVVNFTVEDNTSQPLNAMIPIHPVAGFAYQTVFTGTPNYVGDEDRFTLDLEAGQQLTALLENYSILGQEQALELLDPSGAVIASSAADTLFLNAAISQTGTHTLLVRTLAVSLFGPFDYTGKVMLNAVQEVEDAGGPTNDDLASAQDLSGAFFNLGNGVQQAFVTGNGSYTSGPFTDSFESGSLGLAWATKSSSGGRIQVTDTYGADHGTYALLMDNPSGSSLNEAVWAVDLTGQSDATLSFAYAEWGDEATALPTNYTGSVTGDGVSISNDGVNWHTILNAPNSSTGAWQTFTIDLAEAAAQAGMSLGPDFKIKFQQYDNLGLTSDGRGYDNIRITGSTIETSPPDIFKVTLAQGDDLSVAIEESSGQASLQLLGSTGELLSVGTDTWLDATGRIAGFIAPAAGEYFIQVTNPESPYGLIVTRGADYSPEPTVDSTVLDISATGSVVGSIGASSSSSGVENDSDTYAFHANIGDNLTLWTETPSYPPTTHPNLLDSFLQLYAPDGTLLVEGDAGGDGLNALLNHTAGVSGKYTVVVSRYTFEYSGPYLLHVTGQTGTPPAFEVESATYEDGSATNQKVNQFSLTFNDHIRLDTVDAADLTINGQPLSNVTIVDGRTLRFDFADLTQGVFTFAMAAGAVTSLSGVDSEAFSAQVAVDTVAPRVIGINLAEGDTLEPGPVTLSIEFDEEIDTTNLNAFDVDLWRFTANQPVPIEVFDYDAATSILTLGFNATFEGPYTLQLNSGAKAFADLAGNALDGEAPDGTLPPEVSGDGEPGGEFILSFDVDRQAASPVITPQRRFPLGSFSMASLGNEGYLDSKTDTDTFSVSLQAGQYLTAVLTPKGIFGGSSEAHVTLTVPGALSAPAPDPGVPAVLTLQALTSDQQVQLTVSADIATAYRLDVYLNTRAEDTLTPTTVDGQPARDLAPAFTPVPGSDTQVATVLATGQPTKTITRTNQFSPPSYLNINFVDMTPPFGDGVLTISATGDLGDPLENLRLIDEVGNDITLFMHDGADGVPVAATVLYSQAQLATMASDGTIRFTVYPSSEVDSEVPNAVTLELDYPNAPPEPYDNYALDLQAGETITAIIESLGGTFAVELIDAATGQVVAEGGPDSVFDEVIRDFVVPTTGQYYLRPHVPAQEEYTLTVVKAAAFDLEPNNAATDPLPSLDTTGSALGYLRLPGEQRLFATTSSSSFSPLIYELDPITLEPINSFSSSDLRSIVGFASTFLYDGDSLYIRSYRGATVAVVDPNNGALRRQLAVPASSALGLYQGTFVHNENDETNKLIFVSTDSGEVVRELEVEALSDITVPEVLAGAESRGSIFMVDYEAQSQTRVIVEVDALTGETRNTMPVFQSVIRHLTFINGQLYSYSVRSRDLVIYDPDTGEVVSQSAFNEFDYNAFGGGDVLPVQDIDRHTLDLHAGQHATLSTSTPFDDPNGSTLNNLDAGIRVFDPDGNEVAFNDNGAPDGRNALLSLTAVLEGTYTVEVGVVSGKGEYLLNADKAPFLLGDLNADNLVGIDDLNIVLSHWNQSVTAADLLSGDATGDGFVGIDDLNAVLSNWNAIAPPAQASAVTSAVSAQRSEPVATNVQAPPAKQTQQRQAGPNSGQSPAQTHQTAKAQGSVNAAAIAAHLQNVPLALQQQAAATLDPFDLLEDEPLGILGLWE